MSLTRTEYWGSGSDNSASASGIVSRRFRLILFLASLVILGGVALLGRLGGDGTSLFGALFTLVWSAALILLIGWAVIRLYRVLLWRVGRRLAFTYFLIGVVPVPLLTVLLAFIGYLLAGFFLGHLYRDAVADLHGELTQVAHQQLEVFASRGITTARQGKFSFSYYHNGRKIAGADSTPATWPEWLAQLQAPTKDSGREALQPFVALEDGSPNVAVVAQDGGRAILGLYDGSLEAVLTRRSDVWVRLFRSDDPDNPSRMQIQLGDRSFSLHPFGERTFQARAEFFEQTDQAQDEQPFWKRPVLIWGELSGPVRALEDGTVAYDYVAAGLNGSLETVYRHLFSSSGDIDTAAWAGIIGVTGLLATIYAVAAILALFMTFGLSRAVNRLSTGTEAVKRGDFSVRIPSKRRDQLGELQSSFNTMTENLEELIATAAHKEILEKELSIARDLQQSLLPADLPASEFFEFSTLFEPSAAIGGDYFDILRLDSDHLAVVIADVSGHGLPTGLRMAMLKSALVILFEESKQPIEIFRRLSKTIRSQKDSRYFVTASISRLDFRTGMLELTNAGHPPTYLLRQGDVEEILLPGNPLGTLGDQFGHLEINLQRGDVVVWMSDGLIEITDPSGEPFGYHRVQEALRGEAASVHDVRTRLLTAIQEYTQGLPAEDDKTLVVMRYRP